MRDWERGREIERGRERERGRRSRFMGVVEGVKGEIGSSAAASAMPPYLFVS